MVIVLLLLIALLIFGPSWWVRHVLAKYADPADRYQGTGAELARHLLDLSGLQDVKITRGAEHSDHYNPATRTVNLSPLCHDGRSLTAITVAAHEVGHALQHRDEDRWLGLRSRLAGLLVVGQTVVLPLVIIAPVVGLGLRAPALMWVLFALAFLVQALGTVFHLVTLPVEWDASFGRAMPMLEALRILHATDVPHARRLLRAAAFTYVAGSLFSLLLLVRWIR
jgi:uncharacterized protein